jgi:hypothetical protein
MQPLLSVALFWTVLAVAALAFAIICLKYGVYTSGQHGDHASLEV